MPTTYRTTDHPAFRNGLGWVYCPRCSSSSPLTDLYADEGMEPVSEDQMPKDRRCYSCERVIPHIPSMAGWPLHGATDTEELTTIVNALINGDTYNQIATTLNVSREVVAEVGRWYQSLWMRP